MIWLTGNRIKRNKNMFRCWKHLPEAKKSTTTRAGKHYFTWTKDTKLRWVILLIILLLSWAGAFACMLLLIHTFCMLIIVRLTVKYNAFTFIRSSSTITTATNCCVSLLIINGKNGRWLHEMKQKFYRSDKSVFFSLFISIRKVLFKQTKQKRFILQINGRDNRSLQHITEATLKLYISFFLTMNTS